MKLADILKNKIAEYDAAVLEKWRLEQEIALKEQAKQIVDALAKYPDFIKFIIDYTQANYNDKRLIIDSYQKYFREARYDSGNPLEFYIDTLLQMRFNDIVQFGIENGFEVDAKKITLVNTNTVRGELINVYGPRIIFYW